MKPNTAAIAIEIAIENASARRNARELKTSAIRIQFEADGADINDKAARPGRVELAPQTANLDIDDVGLRHKLEIPNVLKQHCACHDLVGAAHKVFQQGKFTGHEFDQIAIAADGSLNEIHLKRAHLQAREPGVSSPADEGFHPRRELANVEWLDQII